MHQIKQIEDIVGGQDPNMSYFHPGDSSFYTKRNLTCLPVADLVGGAIGFIIYESFGAGDDYKEEAVLPTIRLFKQAEEYPCASFDEYQSIANGHLKKNYVLFEAHDPKRLRLGFLCLKGDGNIWYTLKLSLAKGVPAFEELRARYEALMNYRVLTPEFRIHQGEKP